MRSDYDAGYMAGFKDASAELSRVVGKLQARFEHHEQALADTVDHVDWALGLGAYDN